MIITVELRLTINNHVPEGRKIFFQDLKYKIKMFFINTAYKKYICYPIQYTLNKLLNTNVF